jgi:hypothetical protein
MFYKCVNCGHIFEEGEQAYSGDGWNEPRVAVCPICKDDFEDAVACQCCGGHFLKDELKDGRCEECIEEVFKEYRFGNVEKLYLISSDECESVDLNPFVAAMFSAAQINEILLKELLEQEKIRPVDCSAFINQDKNWFIEKISEMEGW